MVDVSTRRVIGSLMLLLGISFLAVGLYNGQLAAVVEIVKRILEASIAGTP
jgi:uncharacterized membrane protein YiaA